MTRSPSSQGATVLVSPFRPGLVRWHAAPPRGINKLVVNVQAARLDSTYLAQTAVFFKELPTEKADTLAIGLFEVYTAISAEPHTLDNIRDLWPYISDDTRFWAGTAGAD
ncbi:hypothetical protein ACWCO9_20120 [Streptomyces sp. NPDC001937]